MAEGAAGLLAGGFVLLLLATTGCATSSSASGPPSTDCPVAPLPITVSVDQWTDVVTRLAGGCGQVSTILAGSVGDPHDYEPTPGDAAAIDGAAVVVLNGAGYDTWAAKLAESVSPSPLVVDAGAVVGAGEGANPHLWYSPTDVHRVAEAVTAALKERAPAASAYFDRAAADWTTAMAPYDQQVATVRAVAAGRSYGATEGVFDLMAEALGMVDATPPGWRAAAANESEPSPGDVLAFQNALYGQSMDLLIDNVQTEGSAPAAVRSIAESVGVPVVEVTETMPEGVTSFVDWQVRQLQQVAAALGS